MIITIPLVLLLGLVTVLLHRSGDLKARHSLIAVLFGFYLAKSSADEPIDHIVRQLLHGLLDSL